MRVPKAANIVYEAENLPCLSLPMSTYLKERETNVQCVRGINEPERVQRANSPIRVGVLLWTVHWGR